MPDAPAIEVIRKFDASGLFEQTGYIAACVAQIACDDCEIDIFRKVFIHIIHHTLNSRFHPCRWVCVILLQKMKVEEYDFIQPLCAVERCIWIDADSISVESRAPAPDNAQQEAIDGIAQLQILRGRTLGCPVLRPGARQELHHLFLGKVIFFRRIGRQDIPQCTPGGGIGARQNPCC